MKSVEELNKMPENKFPGYINSKCAIRDLSKFMFSDKFSELVASRREVIEDIIFEHYGHDIPERLGWEILSGGEFDARVTGYMPNKNFRRVKVELVLWGHRLSLHGVVMLPQWGAGRYAQGAMLRVKPLEEFGVFEFVPLKEN